MRIWEPRVHQAESSERLAAPAQQAAGVGTKQVGELMVPMDLPTLIACITLNQLGWGQWQPERTQWLEMGAN